jgi:hypothetical protein
MKYSFQQSSNVKFVAATTVFPNTNVTYDMMGEPHILEYFSPDMSMNPTFELVGVQPIEVCSPPVQTGVDEMGMPIFDWSTMEFKTFWLHQYNDLSTLDANNVYKSIAIIVARNNYNWTPIDGVERTQNGGLCIGWCCLPDATGEDPWATALQERWIMGSYMQLLDESVLLPIELAFNLA